MERTNEELEIELRDCRFKHESIRKQLESAETSSDTLRVEYRTIKAQLEAFQSELSSKRSALSSLEKDHNESLAVLLKKEEDLAKMGGELLCSYMQRNVSTPIYFFTFF